MFATLSRNRRAQWHNKVAFRCGSMMRQRQAKAHKISEAKYTPVIAARPRQPAVKKASPTCAEPKYRMSAVASAMPAKAKSVMPVFMRPESGLPFFSASSLGWDPCEDVESGTGPEFFVSSSAISLR